MVEASCGPNNSNCGTADAFFPNINAGEYTGVVWTNGSTGPGLPSNFSNHATNSVGHFFFGNTFSVSPGADDVTVFEANEYLTTQLGVQGNATPIVPTTVVQNHSWAGSFGSDAQDRSALRRLDYVIDTYDVTMSVGVNTNGNTSTDPNPNQLHPNLLSYSYNSITVGNTDAGHSRGVTDSLYGPGRFRPDIVVPRFTPSEATAVVSSSATMLHEVLAGTSGSKSEVMRAILLAGATKEEFSDFVEPSTSVANPWERTVTRPVDDIFGVGELNIFNSYLMTQSGAMKGQYQGSTATPTTVGAYGWDYQSAINPGVGNEVLYDFVVPVGSIAQELSIVLAWNAEVVDTNAGSPFILQEQPLANLDLELVDSVGTTIDQSISTAYPLEHIYLTELPPGTYTLKVSSDTIRDYGIAWRMSTIFDSADPDFNDNGAVDGADFLAWQRGVGTLVDAPPSIGDADGDGDVDADDLALFATAYGAVIPAQAPLSSASAIPEPASVFLAAGYISLYLLRRSRKLC